MIISLSNSNDDLAVIFCSAVESSRNLVFLLYVVCWFICPSGLHLQEDREATSFSFVLIYNIFVCKHHQMFNSFRSCMTYVLFLSLIGDICIFIFMGVCASISISYLTCHVLTSRFDFFLSFYFCCLLCWSFSERASFCASGALF